MTASLKIALRDVIDGVLQWPLWGSLAWRDIRQRYTRTILGPFWLTLSTAIFLTFFSLVYSKLFNLDLHSYLPYLTA
ncbi:MAG TPA: ABC transporter permease, partial [Burkholderiales bacterium]|nr:ABC transporter permease [Burkholderiales bacterium]